LTQRVHAFDNPIKFLLTFEGNSTDGVIYRIETRLQSLQWRDGLSGCSSIACQRLSSPKPRKTPGMRPSRSAAPA